MSLETLRRCDVFRTTQNIGQFRVAIERMDSDDTWHDLFCETGDLSPRAFERLVRFIARGLTTPPPRGKEEQAPAGAAGQMVLGGNESSGTEPEASCQTAAPAGE